MATRKTKSAKPRKSAPKRIVKPAPAPNPDEYNGWTNRETWCAKLWIDNERHTYEETRDIVNSWRGKEDARVLCARQLEEWFESIVVPDLGACFAADMLNAALARINWFEIAENMLSE